MRPRKLLVLALTWSLAGCVENNSADAANALDPADAPAPPRAAFAGQGWDGVAFGTV